MEATTDASIDDRRRLEQARRAALPYIGNGQMADSYDTLHGVRFVSLILETIPPALPVGRHLHYTLYLHDLFLLQSVTQLMQRATAALADNALHTAADQLAWACRLLQYKHNNDGLFPLPAGKATDRPANGDLLLVLDTLSIALLRLLNSGTENTVLGPKHDPRAQLIHLTKILILQVKETALILREAPSEIPKEVVAAHRRCIAAASEGLEVVGDTYLNQFCLVHQIPELLAPLTLRCFDAIQAALQRGDLPAAICAGRIGGDVLHITVSSLWPLIELLYPTHYYAFRENLGSTSGSSSAAIRGKLLTAAYVRLATAVSDWQVEGAQGVEAGQVLEQINRIRALIYRWRGLHMALPRNVLGSNGTKSLMGSPDALKAVETMAESFQLKDPLSRLLGPSIDATFAADSATAELDRLLLAATGAAAQQRFQAIQERTGAWRRVRGTP